MDLTSGSAALPVPSRTNHRRDDRDCAAKPASTLKSVAADECDFLLAVEHQCAAARFRRQIARKINSIIGVVRHHLRLHPDDTCVVLPPDSWIKGGFNLCVFIDIQSRKSPQSSRVVFRCPLPHKLAEKYFPGTIDEKVSCEAGAYAWMQEHCADIRIPRLYAFGFADGTHFSQTGLRPWYFRLWHSLRRRLYRIPKYPLLSNLMHQLVTRTCKLSGMTNIGHVPCHKAAYQD